MSPPTWSILGTVGGATRSKSLPLSGRSRRDCATKLQAPPSCLLRPQSSEPALREPQLHSRHHSCLHRYLSFSWIPLRAPIELGVAEQHGGRPNPKGGTFLVRGWRVCRLLSWTPPCLRGVVPRMPASASSPVIPRPQGSRLAACHCCVGTRCNL